MMYMCVIGSVWGVWLCVSRSSMCVLSGICGNVVCMCVWCVYGRVQVGVVCVMSGIYVVCVWCVCVLCECMSVDACGM